MLAIQTNENEHYSTSDLGSAAALVTQNHKLINIDRSNSARIVFVFTSTELLSADLNSYWNGDLLINAKGYFETQKWLKSRIYNG